jgi:hypothetical protein
MHSYVYKFSILLCQLEGRSLRQVIGTAYLTALGFAEYRSGAVDISTVQEKHVRD